MQYLQIVCGMCKTKYHVHNMPNIGSDSDIDKAYNVAKQSRASISWLDFGMHQWHL